ncbi:hypothetical protein [Candidatus Enterococcus mansonii]|uniref:DUF3784 domain-containing protein n=1 Tax=Candidatus Enterococcus mansonii TaxID=1834181 RepID=A0A242CF49_9ENTE|nr:hypothetical protein [Enterococcus sp. 4G2_DIV0659]OTO08789.1 hypothetical protein A5880_001789 [Enterococcus sp. 4G2_DIV0659]
MLIALIFLFLISVFFLITGMQFIRGKWLFLLAGNNFGQAPTKVAIRAGKIAGTIFLLMSVLSIVVLFSIIYNVRLNFLPFIIIIAMLYSFIVIVRSIKYWLKNG